MCYSNINSYKEREVMKKIITGVILVLSMFAGSAFADENIVLQRPDGVFIYKIIGGTTLCKQSTADFSWVDIYDFGKRINFTYSSEYDELYVISGGDNYLWIVNPDNLQNVERSVSQITIVEYKLCSIATRGKHIFVAFGDSPSAIFRINIDSHYTINAKNRQATDWIYALHNTSHGILCESPKGLCMVDIKTLETKY